MSHAQCNRNYRSNMAFTSNLSNGKILTLMFTGNPDESWHDLKENSQEM